MFLLLIKPTIQTSNLAWIVLKTKCTYVHVNHAILWDQTMSLFLSCQESEQRGHLETGLFVLPPKAIEPIDIINPVDKNRNWNSQPSIQNSRSLGIFEMHLFRLTLIL